jgi:hypothetical protein
MQGLLFAGSFCLRAIKDVDFMKKYISNSVELWYFCSNMSLRVGVKFD